MGHHIEKLIYFNHPIILDKWQILDPKYLYSRNRVFAPFPVHGAFRDLS